MKTEFLPVFLRLVLSFSLLKIKVDGQGTGCMEKEKPFLSNY